MSWRTAFGYARAMLSAGLAWVRVVRYPLFVIVLAGLGVLGGQSGVN